MEFSSETRSRMLGWELLYKRRESHIVSTSIVGRVHVHLQIIFNTRHSDIHNYETINRLLLLVDKVRLESTKLAFFYKGAVIFNDTL